MMKLFLPFMFFCLVTVQAQQLKKDPAKLPVLKFEEMLKIKRAIPLSEIADDIEYVRLELNKDAVICANPSVLVTSKYIFIDCLDVLQFSRSGKFIRKVGAMGKGPREYIMAYHISVNEKTEQVFIHSVNKISIWSFNGQFIKEIPLKPGYWKINVTNTGQFIGWKYICAGNEDNIFALLDEKEKVLSCVPNNTKWPERAFTTSISWSTYNEFYTLNNQTYFKDMYTDTVYTLSSKNKIIPSYFVDLGKYKIPDNHRPSFATDKEQRKQLTKGYLWANVIESNKYIFINSEGYSEKKKYLILRDKIKNSNTVVSDNSYEYSGFANDIDGGMEFWPRHVCNDQWMYTIIPASEFIKTNTEKLKTNQTAKYPEKNKNLKLILANITEEDNPIVIIVKLKGK